MLAKLADPEFILKVIGAVAVVSALLLTWRTHAERATFEMIDRLYGMCHSLEAHALRDFYLAHLFSIGSEEYGKVKELVAAAIAKEPNRITECRIKEKLFAIHVFIIYEQVYYQWVHSSERFHRRRRKFLSEILSYFTDRLIPNPRLLHFASTDKTGAAIHLEPCSKAYLDAALARVFPHPQKVDIDHDGPFVATVQAEAR